MIYYQEPFNKRSAFSCIRSQVKNNLIGSYFQKKNKTISTLFKKIKIKQKYQKQNENF